MASLIVAALLLCGPLIDESTPLVGTVEPAEPVVERVEPSSRGGVRELGTDLGVFKTTSYCLRGITRSGEPAGPGALAVDPAVIPLGTVLRVEGTEGEWRAVDTGSGVLGRHVDLWLPTCRESIQWGVRYQRVWRVEGER